VVLNRVWRLCICLAGGHGIFHGRTQHRHVCLTRHGKYSDHQHQDNPSVSESRFDSFDLSAGLRFERFHQWTDQSHQLDPYSKLSSFDPQSDICDLGSFWHLPAFEMSLDRA